jgi:hypothetical protein
VKVPKIIDVLGVKYKVIVTEKVNAYHPDRSTGALFDSTNKIIYLEPKTKPSEFWMNFLHELKHAHQWESGLFQAMSDDAMEVDAETTARMLTTLFHLRFK